MNKKIITKLFLLGFFLIANGIFAQGKNRDIKKELNNIYLTYNNDCKKSYQLYYKKYVEDNKSKNSNEYLINSKKYFSDKNKYQEVKTKKLIELYQQLYSERKLLGKKIIYFIKDSLNGKENIYQELKNENLQYLYLPVSDMVNKMMDEKSYNKLKLEIINNIESEIFAEIENTLKTKIEFILDIDGTIKLLKPKGMNQEFNYYVAIMLYSRDFVTTPIYYKNEPVLGLFSIPITLIFE